MKKKGFASIVMIGIVIALLVAAGLGYWVLKNKAQQPCPPSSELTPCEDQLVHPKYAPLSIGSGLNSSTTMELQRKTVEGFTYVLTETCDALEGGICYDDLIQLVKFPTSSPRIVLFSTSTPAYPSPSFDISPRGSFAALDLKYSGSLMIKDVSTEDSLIIIGIQKNFSKPFSDIELTTPKIVAEARGRQGYGLMLGSSDNPDGCVDHPIAWSPDESFVSGEICLWNFEVNPAPVLIDSNLFKIDTTNWRVQTEGIAPITSSSFENSVVYKNFQYAIVDTDPACRLSGGIGQALRWRISPNG